MDAHVLQQAGLFPDDYPPYVYRYWDAKERWYSSGTHLLPTQPEFIKKFDPPEPAVRTLNHWREECKKRGHPEWMPWPPKASQQPPWVSLPPLNGLAKPSIDQVRSLRRVRVAGFDDDGRMVTTIQFYDPETGELVTSRLVTEDEK